MISGIGLPGAAYDIWHDRAVFHFLIDRDKRSTYRKQLELALKPGGQIVIATCSVNGPPSCSGLPVKRYDVAALKMNLVRDSE